MSCVCVCVCVCVSVCLRLCVCVSVFFVSVLGVCVKLKVTGLGSKFGVAFSMVPRDTFAE